MTAQGRFQPEAGLLLSLFEHLQAVYGELGWWPGESPFEIMIGAVLTQNTSWSNVEKAMVRLKQASVMSAAQMLALPVTQLAELVRPSGYFNIKAERLRQLCLFLDQRGGEAVLATWDTSTLRQALLSVKGIGPETCDDIVLYAFNRPVFVIDAYTRRLLKRYGLAQGNESYEVLRRGFEQALGGDAPRYQAYHGLIVEHAKRVCLVKPRCGPCVLQSLCPQQF